MVESTIIKTDNEKLLAKKKKLKEEAQSEQGLHQIALNTALQKEATLGGGGET